MGVERPARRDRSEPARTISVSNLPSGQSRALLEDPHVMAVVHFGGSHWVNSDQPRSFGVGVPLLDASADTVEVWRSAAPSLATRFDGMLLMETDDCAFGHLLVDEAHQGGLQAATRSAYERILNALRARGYSYLLRIWHFFPRITSVVNDMERYRAFCVGRHQALCNAANSKGRCRPPRPSAAGRRACCCISLPRPAPGCKSKTRAKSARFSTRASTGRRAHRSRGRC